MAQWMSRQNENKPYVCPRYTMIGESLEREVARRLEMCDKRELEGHECVQQLRKEAEDAEEEKKKQAEELERAETERIREMEFH
nr:hypothetical protein BaRGS_006628 [Batillaria attramentaria]